MCASFDFESSKIVPRNKSKKLSRLCILEKSTPFESVYFGQLKALQLYAIEIVATHHPLHRAHAPFVSFWMLKQAENGQSRRYN